MRRLFMLSAITICLMLGSGQSAGAQEFQCGAITPQSDIEFEQERVAKGWDYPWAPQTAGAVTLPVTFHVIRRSDGSGGLEEVDLSVALNYLNTAFVQVGFQFYQYGDVNYIDDDLAYHSDDPALIYDRAAGTIVQDVINVLWTPTLREGDAYPYREYIFHESRLAASPRYPSVFAHEMGHFFGLSHTHGPCNTLCGGVKECPDGSNCATAGDFLCDTPADPMLLGKVSQPPNCEYDGSDAAPAACGPTPYAPPVRNIMSYSVWTCMDEFSPMQIAKMWYVLQHRYACGLTGSRTILVPQDYASIQEAVDAAKVCDTVLVAPGAYSVTTGNNIDFGGKRLVVMSSAGASSTIITVSHETAFVLENHEPDGSVIRGFTVQGSGGMRIKNSSPLVDSCYFIDCAPIHVTGALSYPKIYDSRFQECSGDLWGGAILFLQSGGEVRGNLFLNNYCYGKGGAVCVVNGLETSTIEVELAFNTFVGNSSSNSGGAVWLIQTSGTTHVHNNTYVMNDCSTTARFPCVMGSEEDYSEPGAWITVENEILTNNLTYAMCKTGYPTWGAVDCNFWQNALGDFNPAGVVQQVPGGTLTALDPIYCDFEGSDYSLSWESPCVGKGAKGVGCGPAPILLTPPDGSRTSSATPLLDWTDGETSSPQQYFTYGVQVDDDVAFSLPTMTSTDLESSHWNVSPGLADGVWYWRARQKFNAVGDPELGIWSRWSEARSFQKFTSGGGNPSCPVLFVEVGGDYIQENPLLTGCELFGYQATVTDHYQIATPVPVTQRELVLQLRELEDEVTYLNSIELLAVEHPAQTKLASDATGKIVICAAGALSPTSAVDETGADRLPDVIAEDGRYFQAHSSGSLVLCFRALGGVIAAQSAQKGGCPVTKPGSPLSPSAELRVEQLTSEGSWTQLPLPPSRVNASVQYFVLDQPVGAEGLTRVRVAWVGAYEVDYLPLYAILPIQPTIDRLEPTSVRITRGQVSSGMTDQSLGQGVTLLRNGDVATFSFKLPEVITPSSRRSLIVKAEGRYEPVLASPPAETGCQLLGNYPNPFNASTTIAYRLYHSMLVTIEVYNVLGQRVSVLREGLQESGMHEIVWEGRDDSGHPVPSGTYLYRIQAGENTTAGKMSLLK